MVDDTLRGHECGWRPQHGLRPRGTGFGEKEGSFSDKRAIERARAIETFHARAGTALLAPDDTKIAGMVDDALALLGANVNTILEVTGLERRKL